MKVTIPTTVGQWVEEIYTLICPNALDSGVTKVLVAVLVAVPDLDSCKVERWDSNSSLWVFKPWWNLISYIATSGLLAYSIVLITNTGSQNQASAHPSTHKLTNIIIQSCFFKRYLNSVLDLFFCFNAPDHMGVFDNFFGDKYEYVILASQSFFIHKIGNAWSCNSGGSKYDMERMKELIFSYFLYFSRAVSIFSKLKRIRG